MIRRDDNSIYVIGQSDHNSVCSDRTTTSLYLLDVSTVEVEVLSELSNVAAATYDWIGKVKMLLLIG